MTSLLGMVINNISCYSPRLADKAVAIAAILRTPEMYEFISIELGKDKDLAIFAGRGQYEQLWHHIDPELLQDRDLVI